MRKFRFIHTADIHLGSILHTEGCMESPLHDLFKDATYTAFSRLCQIAIDNNVQFILISGDLYDKESRSVRANRFFVDCCERLNKKDIEVIVIAGNHDPMIEYQELFALPPNVHILNSEKPEVYTIQKDGFSIARVIGQSFREKLEPRPIHIDYPMCGEDIFNIAVLHTQLTAGDKKYVPCTLAELLGKQFIHYWALGHIHKTTMLNEKNPVVIYPGIPQGRDFGEEGPGACLLVEVDGTDITGIHAIMTSSVIYKRIDIRIDNDKLKDAESLTDLEDYMAELSQELAGGSVNMESAGLQLSSDAVNVEGFIVRWEIKGRGTLHHYLDGQSEDDIQELCQSLRTRLSQLTPFIWTDTVVVRTGMPLSVEDVLAEQAVLKELLDSAVEDCFCDEVTKKTLISQLGGLWNVSDDHEEDDDVKLRLNSRTYETIIEDARQLLLEGLAEGRD